MAHAADNNLATEREELKDQSTDEASSDAKMEFPPMIIRIIIVISLMLAVFLVSQPIFPGQIISDMARRGSD